MKTATAAATLLASSSATLLPSSSASPAPPDFAAIVARVNGNASAPWTARLPSARDVHRARDLVGGYVPFDGTQVR